MLFSNSAILLTYFVAPSYQQPQYPTPYPTQAGGPPYPAVSSPVAAQFPQQSSYQPPSQVPVPVTNEPDPEKGKDVFVVFGM